MVGAEWRFVVLLVCAAGAVIGCGGRSSETTHGLECTVPGAAGGSSSCYAGRYYLTCTDPRADLFSCVSDDATRCPPLDSTRSDLYTNCANQCRQDEYAVSRWAGPGASSE